MNAITPAASTAVRWVLRGAPDGGESLVFRVSPGEPRTLGRATRSDFIVDVPLVSRVHCRLHVMPDGQLEVEDLRSTNGTFVNDRRIERAVLVPGDRLRMGRALLIVQRDVPLPPATEE